ncbi:MAG TPA: CHAD domain-containing protein [Candidatus Didemnitutus sp.]|nr:CHAD domain-containing protein [Candidatus Didemnitutus sp.]
MKTFYDAQWQRLLTEVGALRVSVLSSHVHEMRIATKKVMAVMRSLNQKETMEALRPLYHMCGSVREPEIMMGIMTAVSKQVGGDVSHILRRLRAIRASSIRALKQELTILDDAALATIQSAAEHLLLGMTEITMERAREHYIKGRYKHVCKISRDLDDMEILHRIRRDLKDITYLLALTPSLERAQLRRRSLVQDVESFLGAIHDHAVTRAWIGDLPEGTVNEESRHTFRLHLKNMIRADVRSARTTVASLCRDW